MRILSVEFWYMEVCNFQVVGVQNESFPFLLLGILMHNYIIGIRIHLDQICLRRYDSAMLDVCN